MERNENLYSKNYNTFDEWLNIILNKREDVYPQFKIPYSKWVDDYIKNIADKSVAEVKDLLRLLLQPINRKIDILNYKSYCDIKTLNKGKNIKIEEEMCKRIENGEYAWEGITWALELLPYKPYKAIEALQNYSFSQHGLPDDRIQGIEQCIDIILAKFIYYEHRLEKLLKLKPIEFEWLIEKLYISMGYDTKWTPVARDGGKDIIASIKRFDGYEKVYVECKRYKTTKLDINTVRALYGTISKGGINRGVLFCTGYVNDNIKEFDKRIQIWSYNDINILLNAHMGSDWVERLDIIIGQQRRKYKSEEN